MKKLRCFLLFLVTVSTLSAQDFIQHANELIREGRMADAAEYLEELLPSASAADTAKIERMLSQLSEHRRKRTPDTSPTPEKQPSAEENNPRVIALGGFNDGWHAAMSPKSPYGPQVWTFQKSFPASFIKEQWDKGLRITSIAGDGAAWAVVMSALKDGSKPMQSYWGPGPFGDDVQTWISEKDKEGYKITGVAGFGNNWVFVMTMDTGWGRQRFTAPGRFNPVWLKARLEEGYHVTSASGDKLPKKDGSYTDTYVFVVTQGTGFGATSGCGSEPLSEFKPWFDEQRKVGAPTALFGYRERYGAFLSSGTSYGNNCSYRFGVTAEELNDWFRSQKAHE
jgi:hypothetical protein